MWRFHLWLTRSKFTRWNFYFVAYTGKIIGIAMAIFFVLSAIMMAIDVLFLHKWGSTWGGIAAMLVFGSILVAMNMFASVVATVVKDSLRQKENTQ